MNQYRLKVHTWYSFRHQHTWTRWTLQFSKGHVLLQEKKNLFSPLIKVYGPYHSVWKQSSVLVMPILTRKFLTKSSTISGLWLEKTRYARQSDLIKWRLMIRTVHMPLSVYYRWNLNTVFYLIALNTFFLLWLKRHFKKWREII